MLSGQPGGVKNAKEAALARAGLLLPKAAGHDPLCQPEGRGLTPVR